MQRREFLTAGTASAAVAAVAATRNRGSGPRNAPLPFCRAQFLAWMYQPFRVTAQGRLRRHAATLVAVVDGPRHPGLEQFRVSFRGASALPTGLCLVEHVDGTRFSLYLDRAEGSGAERLRHATFALIAPSKDHAHV